MQNGKIDRDVLITHTKELEELLMRQYPDIISDQGLLDANRQRNRDLLELCRKHKRVLDFMAGEKVEPENHSAEAVLVGIGQSSG